MTDTGPAKPRVLVTGANGHLGRRLLPVVADRFSVTAVVRSESARTDLERVLPKGLIRIEVVGYQDVAGLQAIASGCAAVVHLVGILKETDSSRYHDAHEGATRALLDAFGTEANATRFVYLSILGAHDASTNRCLASKGRAERMLLETAPDSVVIQVPMVLGEGDYAAASLARAAYGRLAIAFRGASLEQPVYAGDVVSAIDAALTQVDAGGKVLRLAGPESLSRAELMRRAARSVGRSVSVLSLPIIVGRGLAACFESVMSRPPLTRVMLEVLDHDDAIDPSSACEVLGLELTSLDEMLGRCLNGE